MKPVLRYDEAQWQRCRGWPWAAVLARLEKIRAMQSRSFFSLSEFKGKTTQCLRHITLACIAIGFTPFSVAQVYPSKPIRLIVPSAAGGPTDVLARLVAEGLSRSLEQPVIVDNRGGVGGAIGARAAASAQADGYTLLFANTAILATIPATSKTAGYSPARSFTAVAKVAESYQVVVVRPDLPVRTLSDLMAYGKANPGKMNFSAAGMGNLTHLSGELLKARTGIDFVTAQYKSGAESLNALLGGQTDFAIENVGAVRPLVKAGKLRALAVTSAARKPEFAELPTMTEAGVSGYVVTSFFGVMAPAGTKTPIVTRLHDAIGEAQKGSAFQASLHQLGAQSTAETSDQFRSFIEEEISTWTALARAANISVD